MTGVLTCLIHGKESTVASVNAPKSDQCEVYSGERLERSTSGCERAIHTSCLSGLTVAQERILVVGTVLKSLTNFRLPLLREMVAAGHVVHASACDAPGRADDSDPTAYGHEQLLSELGISFTPLQVNRAGLNPCKDILGLRQLRALIKKFSPTIIFAYGAKPIVYAGAVAGIAAPAARTIFMITGLGFLFMQSGLKGRCLSLVARTLYKPLLARSSAVVFHNKDDYSMFLEGGLSSPLVSHTVPGSGVDCDKFHPIPETPIVYDFIFIGRILRDKGIRELMEAIRILRARGRFPRVAVVGGLDQNPSGISRKVIQGWEADRLADFFGEVDEVSPFIAQARVLVLPSYREGMPRSVLEAMAMGKAVIASDVPGCRDAVVHNVSGLLVPPRSAEALASAMQSLFNSPATADDMGLKGLAIARSRFEARLVARQTLEVMRISVATT